MLSSTTASLMWKGMTRVSTDLVTAYVAVHGAAWLDDMVRDLAIEARTDGDRVSLKYNAISSPMHLPIVQQCRGMVRRISGELLAWPYNKFWNHGEGLAATIDWSSAHLMDKLDGSLMILYHDDERWCVASSGHPTAGGRYGADERLFRDKFWEVFKAQKMALPLGYENHAFFFELCAPDNRIVVQYETDRLICHGARSRATGKEWDWDRDVLGHHARGLNWPIVNRIEVSSAADALEKAAALDPLKLEGFVVVDEHFNRIKIKCPRYVTLHHMRGDATPRRAIELFQNGEMGETLSYFPELRTVFDPVLDKLHAIAGQVVEDWLANNAAPTRKDFAIAVKDRPYSSLLFRLFGEGGVVTEERVMGMMRSSTRSLLEELVLRDG